MKISILIVILIVIALAVFARLREIAANKKARQVANEAFWEGVARREFNKFDLKRTAKTLKAEGSKMNRKQRYQAAADLIDYTKRRAQFETGQSIKA